MQMIIHKHNLGSDVYGEDGSLDLAKYRENFYEDNN